MGKSNKKKKKRDRQAFLANKHDLYQKAVQEPEADTEFMEKVFRDKFKHTPLVMREDFCGTGFLSATWVAEKKERRAIGYDLDPDTVNWGVENNLSDLDSDQRSRIELRIADVLDAPKEPVDIVCAMNFSWWIFKKRNQLLKYFRSVRSSLLDEGLFVLDMYGGSEAYEEMEEEREKEDFSYIWDQEKVCGITDEVLCHISFHFPDGSKIKRAFSYYWRLWTLPELQELLIEAGFQRVLVYWEGTDKKTGEGSGEYLPTEVGEADAGWICYLSAEK